MPGLRYCSPVHDSRLAFTRPSGMLNGGLGKRGEDAMTVADELSNRNNCRYRLSGVMVAVDGSGPGLPVSRTCWDKSGRLVLVLEDGQQVGANRCHLRSQWPVACCRPKRRNEWN